MQQEAYAHENRSDAKDPHRVIGRRRVPYVLQSEEQVHDFRIDNRGDGGDGAYRQRIGEAVPEHTVQLAKIAFREKCGKNGLRRLSDEFVHKDEKLGQVFDDVEDRRPLRARKIRQQMEGNEGEDRAEDIFKGSREAEPQGLHCIGKGGGFPPDPEFPAPREEIEEADEERVWSAVQSVADKALQSFLSMREREGEKLRADILSRCDLILEHVAFIEARSPETVREYNDKLLERMKTVLEDVHVDEQRLLTEAAIYADKIAVAEETVRLRSHIDQMRAFMDAKQAIGRKMDFLVQEFNREANTIGSKAQDVAIKAEIEKIREQVQNVE